MNRRLVWIDSAVMGFVLVFVGLAVILATVGVGSPLYFGAIAMGVALVAVGVFLAWKGLQARPRSST